MYWWPVFTPCVQRYVQKVKAKNRNIFLSGHEHVLVDVRRLADIVDDFIFWADVCVLILGDRLCWMSLRTMSATTMAIAAMPW